MKHTFNIVIGALLATMLICATATPASAQFWKKKKANTTYTAPEPVAPQPEPQEKEPVKAEPRPRTMTGDEWRDACTLTLGQTAQGYDSLVSQWYERNVFESHDSYFSQFIDLDPASMPADNTPDSVYVSRLRMMVSPIHLGFNSEVKAHILAYTKRKGTISRMIGLSRLYFPMIEEKLVSNGLPVELRMLPIVESALNPNAVSRMGAAGLWQFMPRTGTAYGLEISSYVDERFDPERSTDAACRFLKDLYKMYGDWTLALAAYNCGPGNVNKALKRAGDNAKTFWDIYAYLPRETRGYVPAFIGATYAYTFHRQHSIEPAPMPLPVACDTLHVDRLLHFEQVSTTLGTPMEILRGLNPQYRMDIIPAVDGKAYPITLPQCDVTRYIDQQEAIHAKDSVYLAQYLNKDVKVKMAEARQAGVVEYKIKSGDTLGGVARKYGVTVAQIMKWNNIKNANKLRIGQRIQIYK